MTDIERLLQKICAKALAEFSNETRCGMCDKYDGRLFYDIDGDTYEIIIKKQKDQENG